MGTRKVINKYLDGDWNVICDTCGRKRKASQCTLQMIPDMPNVFVCTESCLDVQNPQYYVRGVPDDISVPIVRDFNNSNVSGYQGEGPYTGPLTYLNLTQNGVH